MNVKVIKTEAQYSQALKRADTIFNAKPNTTEGDELELLLLVIKDYEDKHHAVALPDPIEAIKLRMMEEGLKASDLVPEIGSKSYISQILNRKKPLTASIMRKLRTKLNISAQVLLGAA
ncbi:helix-turn-helix domain-containing protein [soil metagenome]